MIAHHSTFGFKKIFLIVFGIAFGLVALAVISKSTMQSNNDNRSKAAEDNTIYKAWEFDTDAGGWGAPAGNSPTVANGKYTLTADSKGVVGLHNQSVNTAIPSGEKILRISMNVTAVTPFQGTLTYAYTDPTGPNGGRTPQNGSIPLSDSNVTVTGTGGWKEYSLTLPQAQSITVNWIAIDFGKLSSGDTVSIDWIRLLGPLTSGTSTPTPTPIPPITCHQGFIDRFDGTALDTTKWNVGVDPYAGSASVQSGALVFGPGSATQDPNNWNHAYIASNARISGDFRMEIWAKPSSHPGVKTDSAFYVQHHTSDQDESTITIEYYTLADGTKSVDMYNRINLVETMRQTLALPRSASTVRLKLVRKGSTLTGYAANLVQGYYKLVGTIPNAWTGSGYIIVSDWGSTPTALTGSYDNFILQCP